MKYKFIVEHILEGKPTGIFARQYEKYIFQLGETPMLGGCAIKQSITQPRKLKENGEPDFDVFCFYLENGNDKYKFVKGKSVELIP